MDEKTETSENLHPLTALERETTVTMSDGDPLVHINTAQRTVLTRLRRKPEVFTETKTGYHGTTEWAEFTCPRERFNLGAAARPKRLLTPEQREQLAAQARERFNPKQN